MKAYLIFSLKNVISFVNSKNNLDKRNNLFITDKIAISNFLIKNNFKKVECLDSYFPGSIKKKNLSNIIIFLMIF